MVKIIGALSVRVMCILLLLLTPVLVRAQEEPAFRAKPLRGQDTFRVGERIPLELSFSSTLSGRFEINMAGYDRSGRLSYEQFEVNPHAGWTDPLARYFSTGGGIGGGITTFRILGPEPVLIPIDLNEWIQFDQPGTYTVTVRSDRVSDSTKGRSPTGAPPASLRAEPFVLHIVPAPEKWQAEKLEAGLAQLTSAQNANGMQSAEAKAALADVRFLGTKRSIEALAENLREDRTEWMYQSAFGLIGVAEPLREFAKEALRQKIVDPLFPISGWFMETLAILDTSGQDSPGLFYGARSRSHEEVWREVLSGMPKKTGSARATTVQTLLSRAPASLDTDAKMELGTVLSTSFSNLNEEQQFAVLMYQWELLRSPSLLPALQASARLPLKNPGSNEMTVYTRRSLKAMALARWYELDPEGAKQEILLEIGSAKPSLTSQVLWFLPEETLPQFEQLWTQQLLQSDGFEEEAVLAGLLVHFGTGAASDQIAGELRVKIGEWACAPQAATLAYLVKFDPDQARPLLQQALAAGRVGKTGCHKSLFQDVSSHAYGPVLNDAAIGSLNNADPRVAMDALIYLAAYGRPEDKKPIWDRYVQWYEQWQGKAEILDAADHASLDRNYPQIALGENLAHALIANQGWLADHDSISRVVAMCVGQQMCQQVKMAVMASPPYPVTAFRYGIAENYQIGQYTAKSAKLLEQKIAQFPAGTTFRLHKTTPQTGDQTSLEKQVRTLLQNRGMVVESPL